MNALRKSLLIGAVAGAAVLAALAAGADVRMDAFGHTESDGIDIVMRGDDVVIIARDDSEARITPAGDLSIRGQRLAVTDEQRRLLRQYSRGIVEIEHKGMEIGRQAVAMVGGMVGTLVTDLLEDDGDKKLDTDMNRKAEPLDKAALEICNDVKAQKTLQDEIAAEIPAFKPYAVIHKDTDEDCHIDKHED